MKTFIKNIYLLSLMFIPSCVAFAQENVESFNNQNIAVLNEQLRKNAYQSSKASKATASNTTRINALEAEFSITDGHTHDGADSKEVLATNLNLSGITNGHYLYNNAGTVAGQAIDIPAFGSWASRSFDTVYQASTDGFVVGYISPNASGDSFELKTDASNPPTTIRNRIAWTYTDQYVAPVPFMTPVKSGNYYIADYSNNNMAGAVYWLPID